MTKFPIQYKNGNAKIVLESDGTRTTEWPDGEELNVKYPMNVDCKITNYCDLGDKYDDSGNLLTRSKTCEFCHEMSNNKGKHANLETLWDIWKDTLTGTEIALGGGDAMSHPKFEWFLGKLKSVGVIANVTVNGYHIKRYAEFTKHLQKENLIHGLGISYRGEKSLELLPENIDYKNVVFHVIIGVNTYNDCRAIIRWCQEREISPKILLLGYKQYGNGKAYFSIEVAKKLSDWGRHIYFLLAKEGLTVSFDNLALEQLSIKNILDKKTWDELYQGKDGLASLYVDGVEEKYAKSSTSPIKGDLKKLDIMLDNVKNGRKL